MFGFHHRLGDEELRLLAKLRAQARRPKPLDHEGPRSMGAKVSDAVTALVGSWPFIIVQSCLLILWMMANTIAWIKHWDPYPFILLNLVLSFQAAYTAPIIMMSQNRQSELDRIAAKNDYDVNLKAELEIELLHQKIDQMRESEVAKLTEMVDKLQTALLQTQPLRNDDSGETVQT
ncbi:MAG TPA: DUF1003 domain-containing protein [Acidisoma sp.]|jgi:uncharacterized membrane protein|uniref:DUF1003 domain-containing protein n=1 Tax=Acidisoma sp. TaxID=1872115 RepID=UPI002C1EE418|nr:DUF1003 domain-containing protein [Acidisoma sp.]HTI01494.1 DUF1003 domain-containing protein [Acidisoma sp.]